MEICAPSWHKTTHKYVPMRDLRRSTNRSASLELLLIPSMLPLSSAINLAYPSLSSRSKLYFRCANWACVAARRSRCMRVAAVEIRPSDSRNSPSKRSCSKEDGTKPADCPWKYKWRLDESIATTWIVQWTLSPRKWFSGEFPGKSCQNQVQAQPSTTHQRTKWETQGWKPRIHYYVNIEANNPWKLNLSFGQLLDEFLGCRLFRRCRPAKII